ncbi:MAG: class I SAM-dependent methyltransferase [Rhodothalassiaceae bacterium]
MREDPSNGYDAIAAEFMAARSDTGRALVQRWAASLPSGGCVVDVGCGFGEPMTAALIEAGLSVWAIDASPAMVAAFKQQFANVPVACEPAEHSRFFDRRFDAILAIGLIFLLPADRQRLLITRFSAALKPAGRLLLSAPRQVGTWTDRLSGSVSTSLGEAAYRRLLSDAGLRLLASHSDEGGSHYYEAEKP